MTYYKTTITVRKNPTTIKIYRKRSSNCQGITGCIKQAVAVCLSSGLLACCLSYPAISVAATVSATQRPFANEHAQGIAPPLPKCGIGDLLNWDPQQGKYLCMAVANCAADVLLQHHTGSWHCIKRPAPTTKQPAILPVATSRGFELRFVGEKKTTTPRPKNCPRKYDRIGGGVSNRGVTTWEVRDTPKGCR